MTTNSVVEREGRRPGGDGREGRRPAGDGREGRRAGPGAARTVTVEVVVPVYNEEAALEACVRRLHAFLRADVPWSTVITVADNASTDATRSIAERLARELDGVSVRHLDDKGRGRALKAAWTESEADIVAYMDVDLSTDLGALVPLLAPLASGHSDLAIGSRLASSSRVVRGAKREFISRTYNVLLRTGLRTRFSDAQCGFKAARTEVVRELLPLIEDTGWFFDTELLVLAERVGLRIHEVPVDWVDDPDSSVDIVDTALADLKGCWRVGRALATGALPIADLRRSLGRGPLSSTASTTTAVPELRGVPVGMIGQLVRFALVGVASTVAYAVLYLILHTVLGAQGANFVALLTTAVLNTAANRAFTFGVRGSDGAATHHLQGLAVFAFGWFVTAGSLFALHEWAPGASKHVELLVLVLANLVATVTRFVALRWVFRPTSSDRSHQMESTS
ncbi:bifunctional glycosyltransferase family 2/GtrA family protein [Rhodococcus sp. BP-349]|uniref:bifunctional glycosyltransferase family 2/GtrA family protein n=1 Tax=unclassified Rhodococcus (in: high G+C Gram-positive bacteria) TaxID=192944 RepID=UPI001C9AC19F|nr:MULTISPECIES: bifunctional glycosyltransferase family 2/GtrA family protein [unclassified Rhodococcus (in: high G+C Gram-positive bacteria)]MBY6538092.1 bifunctional glycosyltransferase family 2/GtrA family protein [Rhodococcus sp. BP-363]MBY6542429.1 bifunctional glycosyltransferase family 2/GtrA family protein [Rhodococcus sp. BP-369]MBY6561659.1 bifunctional glycosyltransferase family 2/GtrA family protein [Rhodococcus sp. BP-370]MBY6575951.1 bifunctional glycosyltransferase family 2/GtrA